jgi:predicted extracellular nuclease
MYFARRVQAVSPNVVISQVHGGGGNAGSTYKNDFIELFNRGASPVSLNGWSVQYASAAGTSWAVTNLTNFTLQPGQYYLVQEAQGAGGTTNLPSPNATGTINMSGTDGKVALVNSTTALSGTSCTTWKTNSIDFVGYGSATCFEGAAATPTLSATLSALRASSGCTETDSNSADFATGAPNPRNTSSPTNLCGASNQPITPACPTPLNTNQGTATSVGVSATDSDGTVTAANITSTAVPGITLSTPTPAGGVGGTLTATLNVANTTAPGTYNVTIQYSNNDATPQTASCTVEVNVIALPGPSSVAISEVYGGGGNSGATYTNDFIELINRTGSPISLNGWSVQYASTIGTSWQVTPLTNVTLQPGQYYLVHEASGGAVGAPLPAADVLGTINMSATAGKVALVNSTAALTGFCPFGPNVIDFLGFGTGTNCFEGAGPTATLANTTAALRANAGCTDTNSNSADFSTGTPTPRNTASPINSCVAPNQAIIPTCPASLSTPQGTAAAANVSATDADGTVTGAIITGGAAPGITLDSFTPAGAVGGTATAVLNVANTTAVGIYNVSIQYSNNDSPTAQTASCTVVVTVTTPPAPFNAAIKISQVYGGGGNSGSTYKNDFIELYNTGATPADITGWSVQYTGATTAFAPQTTPTPPGVATPLTTSIPAGTIIQPGHYFLIQESLGAGGTTNNPTPDLMGGILVGSTAGKVALVAGSNVLTGGTVGNCPTDPLIVDFVGYGVSPIMATCSETSPTITLTNTTAAIRKNNGCTDTNNNANDFLIDGPIPRNSSSPSHLCGSDPTQLSGIGTATPDYLLPSSNTLLTVNVSPATTPPSTGIAVSADLTSIGGAASQQFYDDATHGDQTAGDNLFSFQQTVGPFISTGVKNIVANLTDAEARSATAPITITVQSPTCGVERWSVKTGGDPDAVNVNLSNVVPTTIANLRSLTPPSSPPDNARFGPAENTVYEVTATMTLYKLEGDVDYHIVLQDEHGATLITEIPCPCCVALSSPFTAGIANARQKFDARFTATTSFPNPPVSVPVRVTGVGFFDFIHGQTGVAPNGIELHPLLDIVFLENTTTTLASSSNPSQYGQSVQITATVTSAGTNVPTGNVTFKDGATVISSSTLNGSGQVSFSTTSLSVGSHSITASYPGDGYSLPSTSTVLTQVVNKADQFITFGALPDKTYGDPPFTVSATGGGSGNPVSFGASGNCTSSGTNGSTITITGAGSCTVTASQAGDGNYNPAPDVGQSFAIAKADQTIAFAALPDKTYGDPPFTVSATGGGSANQVTFNASGNCTSSGVDGSTTTITGAGPCTVTASQAGNGNYNAAADVPRGFTINQATATISVSGYTGVYDGNAHGATGSATGVSGEDLTSLLNPGASFTDVPGGTAHWTFSGNTNYAPAAGDAPIAIGKASSTTAVTCPLSETYTAAALTPCTVAVTGASLSLTPAANYANNTNAGTATASYTYTGDLNHEGSSDSKNFEINRANATISVTPYSVTYDGNPHTATGSARGVNGESLSGLDLTGTTHTDAGTYNDPWTFTDVTGSYNNTSGTVNDSISQANALITVNGYSGVYDGAAHGATGSAMGVNSEDLISLLSLGATFTNVPGGTAHWTFAGNTNYAPASGDATITITKATPTITWNNPADIVYGTVLSSTQLNATANVSGSFSYTPGAGTLLNAGSAQPLLASFAPTDTTNYNPTSKNVQINVLKASPSFSDLSSPTIGCHAASTSLSGKITLGSFVPTGSVAITLNGVTQNAAIQPDGTFSSSFNTGSLTPVNSPLSINVSYGGDVNFNSASGTGTLTIVDTTPPTVTAPGPMSAASDINCQAPIPNILPQVVASDSCSAVTLQQSPTAGTLVGVGPHEIVVTATDVNGNNSSATTTFTVNGIPSFSLSVAPTSVRRGGRVTLTAAFNSCATTDQLVSFKVNYTSACNHALIWSFGPVTIHPGQHGSQTYAFNIPSNACTGVYALTLDWYTGGTKMGTTTAQLTVIP